MSGTITTPEFVCGFEENTASENASDEFGHWANAGSGSPTIVAARGTRGGNYAMSCAAAGAAVYRRAILPAAVRTWAIRFYWVPDTSIGGTCTLFQMNTAGGGFMQLQGRATNQIRLNVNGTASANSGTLNVDQEYLIDILFDTSGTTYSATLWIDGSLQFSGAVTRAGQTASDMDSFYCGVNTAITHTSIYDDLVLSSTSGDAPIGAGVVLGYAPTGVGTHSFTANDFQDDASANLATNETTSWSKLDELPPVNTDFVKQVVIRTTGYLEYTYTIRASAKPRAVCHTAWVHNVSTSANTQKLVLNDGTSQADSYALMSTGTGAGTVRSCCGVHAAAPSGAWTGTLASSTRSRWGYSGDVTTNPALDLLFLEMEYLTAPQIVTAAGTITSAGALVRKAVNSFAGTITSAGALLPVVPKSFAGTITSTGTVVQRVNKSLAGSIASAGALVRSTSAHYAGTITSAGALVRRPNLPLAGAIASAGVLVRVPRLALAGAIASAGALRWGMLKVLAGAIASAGALAKVPRVSMAGAIASAGALVTSGQHVLSVAGTIASSGALTRVPRVVKAGTITSAGTVAWRLSRTFAGTVTSAGDVTKRVVRTFTGSIDLAGNAIHWVLTFATFTGSIALAGSLSRTAVKTMSGTIASSGAFARAVAFTFAGTIASSGTLAKTVVMTFAGVIEAAGSVGRAFGLAAAGTITMIGSLVLRRVRRGGPGPTIAAVRQLVPSIRNVNRNRPGRG